MSVGGGGDGVLEDVLDAALRSLPNLAGAAVAESGSVQLISHHLPDRAIASISSVS